MSAANPSAIPGDFAAPILISKPLSEPPVRLPRLLTGLFLAVAVFDLCFWNVNSVGLSLAIFSIALAAIIVGNRDMSGRSRTSRIILALLAGAAFATLIEFSATNGMVLVVLVVALAGHTYFTGADSFWGRWLSQIIALLFAPGRIFWLGARLLETAFQGGPNRVGRFIGGVLLVIPALVLALVFGSLLASGNAIFGSWTNSFFDWLWSELALYLNGWRIAMWVLVAFVILPLLRPTSVSDWWWRWTEHLPRLPEIIPARGAFFSSSLVLIVLNLLFFIANFADALFLWSGKTTVPVGVTYSGYVHDGVNALTWTVILSAVILTMIFQQSMNVAARRELKVLALVWIAQNLFLLLSVALRLKLYIEAYDMTVLRLSVIIFLVLVASGFGLLTVKIVQNRSLSWLVGGCAVAVLATLYITQFLNLAGWSATYNVARWEADKSRPLDLLYIDGIGPAGWPALRSAIDNGAIWGGASGGAEHLRYMELNEMQARLTSGRWREFSLRAWMNREALEEKPNN